MHCKIYYYFFASSAGLSFLSLPQKRNQKKYRLSVFPNDSKDLNPKQAQTNLRSNMSLFLTDLKPFPSKIQNAD